MAIRRNRCPRFAEGLELACFGTPEEVANLVVVLASEDGSYGSGSDRAIDGGLVKAM